MSKGTPLRVQQLSKGGMRLGKGRVQSKWLIEAKVLLYYLSQFKDDLQYSILMFTIIWSSNLRYLEFIGTWESGTGTLGLIPHVSPSREFCIRQRATFVQRCWWLSMQDPGTVKGARASLLKLVGRMRDACACANAHSWWNRISETMSFGLVEQEGICDSESMPVEAFLKLLCWLSE